MYKYDLMFFINLVVYRNYPEKIINIFYETMDFRHLRMVFFYPKKIFNLKLHSGLFSGVNMWFICFSTFSNAIKLVIELNSDSIPFFFFKILSDL